MGILTQGTGYGTAAQAGASSINWGTASTGLGATGDFLQGIGQFQQAGYASQVAANNASIARQNAGSALAAGSYEESASKERTGQLIGEQKAAQGANGVDVNVGSPVAVRQSTANVGALDAAMIHYNAARQAFGEDAQANTDEAQSKLDKMAGQNAVYGGLFKAGGTLLSGASSLSSKYAQMQLSGA